MANRPFDLRAALSGEPVQYRDLCTCYFLRTSRDKNGTTTLWFSRVGEASDHIETTLDGDVTRVSDGGCTRVTMAPRKTKKTVWVNFYKDDEFPCGFRAGTFSTEAKAKAFPNRVDEPHPVEIEVEE